MFARTKTFLVSSVMVVTPGIAFAQSGAVEKAIEKVEKPVLTLAGARIVATAAETEAKRLNTTGAIAVVDDGGNLLYLIRTDNTFPAPARMWRWTRREQPPRSACPRATSRTR